MVHFTFVCACGVYVLHTHESMIVSPLHVHARTGHGMFPSTSDLVIALIQSLLMNWKLANLLFQRGWLATRLLGFASASQYEVSGTCIYASLLCEYWEFEPRTSCFQSKQYLPLSHLPRS